MPFPALRLACALLLLPVFAMAETALPITDAPTQAGIRLVHLPLPQEKQQAFAFDWRDRDVQHNPEKAGLLALAPALMVLGGSKSLDGGAFAEDLKDLDARFSLHRSTKVTNGLMVASPDALNDVVAITAPLIAAPRLPPKQLERQKRNLINTLKAQREKAETIASLALSRYLVGQQPQAAWLFLEPESRITAVSVADVAAWHEAIFIRNTLTVVAAGPLDREAAAKITDQMFGALKQGAAVKPPLPFSADATPKTIIIERPVEQTILMLGGVTTWDGGKAGLARALALTVLGGDSSSRLFIAVRDKLGAAYGASAGVMQIGAKHFRFSMQASVSHDKRSEALAAMRAAYAEFYAKGVSEKEIAPLKIRFLTQRNDALSKADSAASIIRSTLESGLSIADINAYQARLDAVTAQNLSHDIQAKLPQQLTTIIVTPSAEGLQADCIINDQTEVLSCR